MTTTQDPTPGLTATELAQRVRSDAYGNILPRGCRDGAILLERLLRESADLGHVERIDGQRWRLTTKGRDAMRSLTFLTPGDGGVNEIVR
jgi:hypothetical protein